MLPTHVSGHCPAHQSLLVKCNEEGDWILLGGDVAHAQDLYWHEDLVKPYSLEQDRRSVPGQFKFTPEDTEWSCMQDFPDLAFGTLSGLARFEMEPNVIVLPAHEVEAIDAAGLQPGGVHDLTNWRKDGLKEKKHELGRQRAERLSQL